METSIREILEHHGYKIYSENSRFYKTKALYRNGDNPSALSIDKENGYFWDFVTGEKGSLEKLLKLTTGIIVEYKIEKTTNFCINSLKEDTMYTVDPSEVLPLLPSYSFYEKRGISTETLKYYEAGLCTRGIMNDRIVFPIKDIDSGEIIGWAGRDVLNKEYRPKWKLKHSKNRWFYPYYYNSDYILKSQEVILIEGISDLLALHEAGIRNCIVIFGVALSKFALSKILEINPKRIIISLNNDDGKTLAGQTGSNKIYQQLTSWFNKDKIEILLPSSKKDFGEMTKSEIIEWANTNKINYV